MQQIYKITPKAKCGFNKVTKKIYWIETALWDGCSSVNLLDFFRTLFTKNTSKIGGKKQDRYGSSH